MDNNPHNPVRPDFNLEAEEHALKNLRSKPNVALTQVYDSHYFSMNC